MSENWAGPCIRPWSTHRFAVLAASFVVAEEHSQNVDGATRRASKPVRDAVLRRLQRKSYETHARGHLPFPDPRIAAVVPAAVAAALAVTVVAAAAAAAAAAIAAAVAAAAAAAGASAQVVHVIIDRSLLLLQSARFVRDEGRGIKDALGDQKLG